MNTHNIRLKIPQFFDNRLDQIRLESLHNQSLVTACFGQSKTSRLIPAVTGSVLPDTGSVGKNIQPKLKTSTLHLYVRAFKHNVPASLPMLRIIWIYSRNFTCDILNKNAI